MPLTPQVEEVVEQAGTDVGELRTRVGDLGDLITVDDTDIVSAINEVKEEITDLAEVGAIAEINDLTDVVITSVATANLLRYNGTNWVNATLATTLGANLTALDVASTSFGRGLLNLADAAALRTSVGAASETQTGVAELSTSAEGIAGVDTVRIVTPKVLTDTLAAKLATVAFSGSASDITTGTLPTGVLPAIAITDVSVVANTAAMILLTAQKGDVAVTTATGKTYILSTNSPSTLGDWIEMPAIGAVTSVAGQQGVVVLSKSDVGLGNVDNTADADKPISDDTQVALDNKQDLHGNLTALSGLSLVTDRLPYSNGTGTMALTEFSADARILVGGEFTDMRADLDVWSKSEIGDVEIDLLEVYTTARDA